MTRGRGFTAHNKLHQRYSRKLTSAVACRQTPLLLVWFQVPRMVFQNEFPKILTANHQWVGLVAFQNLLQGA